MMISSTRTRRSHRMGYWSAMLAFSLLTGACKKHYVAPTQYPYTFINQSTVPLTLDLYGSEEDYNNNTARLERHTMAVGDTQVLIIDVGKTYWYDWYSSDYRYSNWAITDYTVDRSTTIEFGKTSIYQNFQVAGPDTVRTLLLGTGGLPGNWAGKDTAADSLHGTHQFQFRKDKTGTHTYQGSNGTVSLPFTYRVSDQRRIFGYIESYLLNIYESGSVDPSYFAICRLSDPLPSSPLTGPDTLMIGRAGSTMGFAVKRD